MPTKPKQAAPDISLRTGPERKNAIMRAAAAETARTGERLTMSDWLLRAIDNALAASENFETGKAGKGRKS